MVQRYEERFQEDHPLNLRVYTCNSTWPWYIGPMGYKQYQEQCTCIACFPCHKQGVDFLKFSLKKCRQIHYYGMTISHNIFYIISVMKYQHFKKVSVAFFFTSFVLNDASPTTNRILSNETYPTLSPTMQDALPLSWEIEEIGYPYLIEPPNNNENAIVHSLYNLSNRDFDVDLFQSDCKQSINTSLAYVMEEEIVSSGDGFKTVDVSVNFNMTRLNTGETGEVWTNTSTSEFLESGNYTYCIRAFIYADLGDGIDIINFLKTPVTISYDLGEPVSFGEDEEGDDSKTAYHISRDEVGTSQEIQSYKFEDYIIAFLCDDAKNELVDPDPITQGDSLTVCITIKEDSNLDIGISELKLLQMTQEGQFGFSILQDNVPYHEELTMYDPSSCLEGICQVKFQVLARYFEDAEPNDLKIQGTASIRFLDRRNLIEDVTSLESNTKSGERSVEEEDGGGFSLSIKVSGEKPSQYYSDGTYNLSSSIKMFFIFTSVIFAW